MWQPIDTAPDEMHRPTCKLRFFHTTLNGVYIVTLQQWWDSDYTHVSGEWRDIPTVKG